MTVQISPFWVLVAAVVVSMLVGFLVWMAFSALGMMTMDISELAPWWIYAAYPAGFGAGFLTLWFVSSWWGLT